MDLGAYAQALGQAQQLVPSWDEPDMRRAQLQGLQAQTQLQQQQAAIGQQEQADGQAFQADVAALGARPTEQQYNQLALRHPRMFQPIHAAAQALGDDHRRQLVSGYSQIASAIVNGQPEAAAQIIERHINADKAAGQEPDPDDVAHLAMLRSGDPNQVKAAGAAVHGILAALDPKVASAVAPDTENHFVPLGGGLALNQRTGDITGERYTPPHYMTVRDHDAQGREFSRVIQVGGEGGDPSSGGEAQPNAVPATGAAIESAALSAVPGLRVTSRSRSAAHNAAVGGVANSFHLTDQARDFVPPAGMTISALGDQLRHAMPGYQVITESNHVHVEPHGHPQQARPQGGARVVFSGQPGPVAASSAGGDGAVLDTPTISMMAQQYLAGDPSVLTNLGRGRQGAGNIVKLRAEIARQATSRGMTGAQVAAQMVQFKGDAAASRTAGTRSANADLAVTEARNLIPLALQASNALPRSSFLPFSKAEQSYRQNTNNPLYREFVAANNSLVNTYARAISPSGQPALSDKDHARQMLDTAFDQPSYARVVHQLDREMQAALAAPGQVRQDIYRHVGGGAGQPQSQGGPRQVRSVQEAMGLPKGTVFLDPRGVRRVR